MANFLDNLLYIFQRVNWLSGLDILLVTLIFFAVLYSLRDTQAMVLLRGVIFLVVMLVLFTTLVELPAFSWLVQNSLPALLLAIPVIFGPEIRRALERLGRAGIFTLTLNSSTVQPHDVDMQKMLGSIVEAATRLSARQHGALIVIQRQDGRPLQLDGVAIRIHQVHRGAMPKRAVAALHNARLDAMSLQVSDNLLLIELCQANAVMIHVAPRRPWRATALSASRAFDVNQIDQGRSCTQLG